MIVVVDTNIVFSALLAADTKFAEKLLDKSYRFIAPHFMFTELFKHKEKIQRYSKLNEDELLELINLLLSNIQFIQPGIISSSSIKKALDICSGVDLKDVPFMSLCFEYNAFLWTGDETLKKSLSKKNFTNFFK